MNNEPRFNYMSGGMVIPERLAQMDQEDVRLDDNQRMMMQQMLTMDSGVRDEHEAKIRVLNIAAPPDHFKRVANPNLQWPKMLYHGKLPKWQVCKTPEDYAIAKEAGWLDAPLPMHLEKLQNVAPVAAAMAVQPVGQRR